jgi:short-subunit dehydrogenase
LKDKVVVITGATSGIGRALAIKYAAMGSRVVANGRDQQRLDSLKHELDKEGNANLVLSGDVSSEQDCKRLIDETIQKFGRIDILVNNAGISMRALFSEMDLEVFRRVMNINFWGAVYTTKYAIPHLLETQGTIVGISSIAGKKGLPGRTGYSASKFAMEGFLEALRLENRNRGLHVLVACPGFTESRIRENALDSSGNSQLNSPRDEKGMMTAEQVADRLYEAIRSRKRDLVLTGQGRIAVLLNKLFPKLADSLTYKHLAKEPGSPFQ